MNSTMEMLEAIKRIDEGRFKILTSEMLAFFRNNEEEVASLLSKIKIMNQDMLERTDNVCCALDAIEEQEEGRKVRVNSMVPVYTLDGVCECEIQIEDDFCLVIALIITPHGWKFKVHPRKYWNCPVEQNQQRATAWYEAQAGPRTFSYHADPNEIADQLRRLIESAKTDPFPVPKS